MSQNHPDLSNDGDDEISLAVSYQGLRISVIGPSEKALDFVHRLSPDYQPSQGIIRPPGTSSTAASSGQSAPASPPCPDNVLALATRLSAASILKPEERIRRAWSCGVRDRARIEGRVVPYEPIVSIDLPINYYVVARAQGVSEPRILRSQKDYRRSFAGLGPPEEIGCEFPSETEARAYITALGYGHFAGV